MDIKAVLSCCSKTAKREFQITTKTRFEDNYLAIRTGTKTTLISTVVVTAGAGWGRWLPFLCCSCSRIKDFSYLTFQGQKKKLPRVRNMSATGAPNLKAWSPVRHFSWQGNKRFRATLGKLFSGISTWLDLILKRNCNKKLFLLKLGDLIQRKTNNNQCLTVVNSQWNLKNKGWKNRV